MVEPIDIRTGKPFVSRRCHEHHPPSDGASLGGMSGRARGLMGGAFMGTMMAQQGGAPLPYDASIEYLESAVGATGPYISTGVMSTDIYGYEIGMSYRSSTPTWSGFGQNSYYNFMLDAMQSGGTTRRFRIFIRDTEEASNIYLTYDTVNTISIRHGEIRHNGTLKKSYTDGQLSTKSEVHWLWRGYRGAMPCVVYYCKIYGDGDALLRDYIPVRIGQVGYLYDRANPTGGSLGNGLYPNNGTGNFVLGPDV